MYHSPPGEGLKRVRRRIRPPRPTTRKRQVQNLDSFFDFQHFHTRPLRHFYEHSVYCRTMSSTRTRSVELRDITSTTTNVGTTGSPSIVPEDTNVATSTSTVGEDRKERLWVGFRAATIIFQLSAINFLSSFVNGVIVVGLPAIAADLGLSQELYLWPSSIYGLTSGATLLLAGSIADVVGSRMVDLIGCIGAGVSALACGLSRSGVQLVAFRALAGVAMSMHLPCSVSIVTQTAASGKPRNIAFSCLGLSQPLGFSFGLVLGGVFVDTTGWRTGFYIPGAAVLAFAGLGFFVLPRDAVVEGSSRLSGLKTKVDWVGATIASGGLAMFSYVLA